MTLQEAHNTFESLKTKATTKSEINIYEKFLHILKALKHRALSQDEMQAITTKLENLNINSNPENRKKFYKKALIKFEKHLKENLSLTTKDYYTKLSVSLGILFGVVAGVLLGQYFEKSLGISFGICTGLFIGAFVGRRKDAQAQANGNML
ncbi:hypothetical protein [Psychroserpens damuponensis]|uniref:hypothetical protein n=1 Tax=Psychroserpens damuponensis TaxID=943936 RepID=UPI0005909A35|nr:hypothetical protein [Psychroserpens damuponensis]